MSEPKNVPVKDLELDLGNYRTVAQPSEESALHAMIATSPDRFWALMGSLLDDGYLPTESVLVLRDGTASKLVVKEGNRRVAAMKVILGLLDRTNMSVPAALASRLTSLDASWANTNSSVPCVVYDQTESTTVDRIVTLAHGKGERAGRDQWNAVARARHNRDAKAQSEPPLDLLEKYLKSGKNRTPEQASRWSGDYPLTVLEEAMKKIAPRLQLRNSRALADAYPSVKERDSLEQIMKDIGLTLLKFEGIRDSEVDFMTTYGLPEAKAQATAKTAKAEGGKEETKGGAATTTKAKGTTKAAASSAKSPQTVKALLRNFTPKGPSREKVVVLRDEAHLLNIAKTPLAFCFIIRSMFEISAKAYCDDHAKAGGPKYKKSGGQDRQLADVLRDVTKHLSNGEKDQAVLRQLHGAITELARKDGLLSVTSMNQLVHSPTFMITPNDVCVLFGNIFPLLEAMNA